LELSLRERSGGLVGGQIGYRWQFNQFVVGVEGQGDWADLSNTRVSLINPLFSTRTKTDGIGLITGQIGYAWNASLFYFKGGAAVTDNRFSILSTLTGAELAAASATRWVVPWGSAGSTASHRTGLPVLNTTICLWVTQTTRSRSSVRLLTLFSTIGSAKTWIWSPYALTTASVAGEHLSRPAIDLHPNLAPGIVRGLFSARATRRTLSGPAKAIRSDQLEPPARSASRIVSTSPFAGLLSVDLGGADATA
jgi:hypothetical protein